MAEQPELALRWRLALREALLSALSQGFQATRFMAGSYLLVRSD
jgi:predicted GNAT superfamily acetyltransferase